MPLIWQQVVIPCCRFFIFQKNFGRYFDRYVFKCRYKTLVSVKLHYGTIFFFVYVSGFQKDLLYVGNCAGFMKLWSMPFIIMVIVCLKIWFSISGDIPLATLYISVASACTLLWWREAELISCKSYSKF